MGRGRGGDCAARRRRNRRTVADESDERAGGVSGEEARARRSISSDRPIVAASAGLGRASDGGPGRCGRKETGRLRENRKKRGRERIRPRAKSTQKLM